MFVCYYVSFVLMSKNKKKGAAAPQKQILTKKLN